MLHSATFDPWNADPISLHHTAERERSSAAHAAPCPIHRGAQGRPTSRFKHECQYVPDTSAQLVLTMAARRASDIMRMAPAQGGAIINTGSMAAVAANPEQCSYVATKHALLGFSMSAFEVLRHHGVKVAIINPGASAYRTEAREGCYHASSTSAAL